MTKESLEYVVQERCGKSNLYTPFTSAKMTTHSIPGSGESVMCKICLLRENVS